MAHREIFRALGLPLFQNKVYRTRAEAQSCPVGDVILAQDTTTGLIENIAFEPHRMVYDESYQNEQAHSEKFKAHLTEIVGIVARHFRGGSLIEVGCGKGYFLERLKQSGYTAIGIDPAYEGDNPDILKRPFDRNLGVSADGIVLRHVLEHVQNPHGFLEAIADANGRQGKIFIEVPCFDWIMRNRAWFDIFYEHVNYFSERDFRTLFDKIVESGSTFGGQYLYVVAELADLKRAPAAPNTPLDFPDDMLFSFDKVRSACIAHERRRKAVWGASSKGVIFLLYLQRAAITVDCVIDINPAKQEKYTPVTGYRIQSPESAMTTLQAGDLVFVMNSNYLDEIVRMTGNIYNYVAVDV